VVELGVNLALDLIAGMTLAPLLWVQGKWVRRVTPILPEIAEGRTGEAGQGRSLRLLILGDSAAAGVGATQFHESLAGQLVANLIDHRHLTWQIWARSGSTTQDILTMLADMPPTTFDAVVTSLGVNDVTSGLSRQVYIANYQRCVERLRHVHGIERFIISGFPPVGQFPALPHPLRWVLGLRCRKLDRALRAAFAGQSGVDFVTHGTMDDASLTATDVMASDGFHPGPPVYADWARQAAGFLLAGP
jgi:lysophospholipase L1-like esterase